MNEEMVIMLKIAWHILVNSQRSPNVNGATSFVVRHST